MLLAGALEVTAVMSKHVLVTGGMLRLLTYPFSCFPVLRQTCFPLLTKATLRLVATANSGIGLALCKLLATGKQPASEFPTPPVPPCHVYLGSRSAERGAAVFVPPIVIAHSLPGAVFPRPKSTLPSTHLSVHSVTP